MSNLNSIKIEVFSDDILVISFEFSDGATDIKHLINGQLLSGSPTLFLSSALLKDDVSTLALFSDRNSSPQKAEIYSKALFACQQEFWDMCRKIDRYVRGLKRGVRSDHLVKDIVAEEIYQGEDDLVRNRLENIANKITSSLYPIQRTIDVLNYAEAMGHYVRIYWD